MSNTIRKMYDNDNADVSVGIMIDMKSKTETFVIGSSADLILWAESGFPGNLTSNLVRHTNEIGSVIKNINKLIRFSRETDAFLADEALELYDKKYGEVRATVLKTKNSLPKKVQGEDIERFSHYCERERDMLKEFSDELRGEIKKQDD